MRTKAEALKMLCEANAGHTPAEVLDRYFHCSAWRNLTDSIIVFDDGSVVEIGGTIRLWDELEPATRATLVILPPVKWEIE